jgi:hypothetical protein
VTGDALCSLSPVHAQGMSVAALEATLLRRLLAEGTQQLAPRFFTAAAGLLRVPWAISCGPGPGLRGPRPAGFLPATWAGCTQRRPVTRFWPPPCSGLLVW